MLYIIPHTRSYVFSEACANLVKISVLWGIIGLRRQPAFVADAVVPEEAL